MNRKPKSPGFTLIELMVTVAIIGILSGIAYPAYMESVRKTNRSEAKAELMDVAQRLQRCYTALGKFNDTTNCAVYTQVVSTSPVMETKKGYYKIYFDSTAPTATTYKLHAEALKKPQTLDTKDGCNDLTVDQNGTTLPVACW
jgi:prepilin-type N-terminal cleavage/methylation domain-containing protein